MIELNSRKAWICLFDILGFKEIIKNSSNDIVRGVFQGQLDELLEKIAGHLNEGGIYKRHVYADTIVLSLEDGAKPKSVIEFINICKLIFKRSIYIGLPLRGAISFGEVYDNADPPILLGKAYLDAYEYEADQDWLGLLLTPSGINEFTKFNLNSFLDFVVYNIPLRKKRDEEMKPMAYRFEEGATNFENPILHKIREMRQLAPDSARSKYDRTIEFINKFHRSTL